MNPSMQELLASLPKPVVQHIQHLERMRQDFVANVSHELRTPLTVIHGYLETLLEQRFDETLPWQKIFTQMQQQTLRMENLVENLLLLSQLENQQQDKDNAKSVSVAALLTAICNEAKELSGEAQHHFQLSLNKDLTLLGYKDELHSLFSNIIFNAVKYTPAQGSIHIDWYSENKQAYFKVSDSGIGIAEEHISRVTERFYRVDTARSRSSGGTGLGLAIAKHVLIRHQATLDISSKPGEGSIFTCIFPQTRLLPI